MQQVEDYTAYQVNAGALISLVTRLSKSFNKKPPPDVGMLPKASDTRQKHSTPSCRGQCSGVAQPSELRKPEPPASPALQAKLFLGSSNIAATALWHRAAAS